jgi:hypothetical protein
MASRGRRKICLPRFPRDYHSRLVGKNNLLTVSLEGRDAVYALDGFLEMTLNRGKTKRGVGISASVWTVNVAGRLKSGPKKAPKRLHLRLAGKGTGAIAIDARSGFGEGLVPVEITYDELIASRKHRLAPAGHVPLRLLPVTADLTVSVHYDLERGGFRLSAAAMLADFPPLSTSPVAAGIILACLCDPSTPCLNVCLSVKVRKAPPVGGGAAVPVVTRAQVDAALAGVNRLWACEPPGQCCVRFSIAQFIEDPALGAHLTIAGLDAAWRNAVSRNRHGTCFDVYFINTMGGLTNDGATVYTGANSGTVLATTGITPARMIENISHELGHALGLANGPATPLDPDGVDTHSDKPGNIMSGTGAVGTTLNEKQCKKARGSAWARVPTPPRDCTIAPLG